MNVLPILNYGIVNNYRQNAFCNNKNAVSTVQNYNSNAVSFKMSKYTMADAFEYQLRSSETAKRMKRIATTYLDIIESVAMKLKSAGVSFDRLYCEKHPIKTPESCVSKVSRSGSLKVPDQIRATLYCSNIYDLSVLNDAILPAFEERGFVVAKTEVPLEKMLKKGHVPTKSELEKGEVIIPDLDIRLYGVNEQVTKLNPKLRYSISQPQSSGYEDIQIRFVRDYDNSKNPILHELIILPGENFSKAKDYESQKIYGETRKLDELNFLKNIKDEKALALAKRYILIIKSMLNLEISQKLFGSAKNLDVYGIEDNITINLSPQDISVIKNYFTELRLIARKFYDMAEIRAKSPKRLKMLKAERAKDSLNLTEVQRNILESINFFNNAKTFKNLPKIN